MMIKNTQQKKSDRRKLDRTGIRYGRLVVTQLAYREPRKTYWICQCDCGNMKQVLGQCLTQGFTRSCGCLLKESRSKQGRRRVRRGKITPEYESWRAMIQRCKSKNYIGWKYYGGRGIKVCKRWEKFENFVEDMGLRPKEHTLDRIDNDKGYYKDNCKWSTLSEQNRNTQKNSKLLKETPALVIELAEKLGIKKTNANYSILQKLAKAPKYLR